MAFILSLMSLNCGILLKYLCISDSKAVKGCSYQCQLKGKFVKLSVNLILYMFIQIKLIFDIYIIIL